jgi:hypothetical protein
MSDAAERTTPVANDYNEHNRTFEIFVATDQMGHRVDRGDPDFDGDFLALGHFAPMWRRCPPKSAVALL